MYEYLLVRILVGVDKGMWQLILVVGMSKPALVVCMLWHSVSGFERRGQVTGGSFCLSNCATTALHKNVHSIRLYKPMLSKKS